MNKRGINGAVDQAEPSEQGASGCLRSCSEAERRHSITSKDTKKSMNDMSVAEILIIKLPQNITTMILVRCFISYYEPLQPYQYQEFWSDHIKQRKTPLAVEEIGNQGQSKLLIIPLATEPLTGAQFLWMFLPKVVFRITTLLGLCRLVIRLKKAAALINVDYQQLKPNVEVNILTNCIKADSEFGRWGDCKQYHGHHINAYRRVAAWTKQLGRLPKAGRIILHFSTLWRDYRQLLHLFEYNDLTTRSIGFKFDVTCAQDFPESEAHQRLTMASVTNTVTRYQREMHKGLSQDLVNKGCRGFWVSPDHRDR